MGVCELTSGSHNCVMMFTSVFLLVLITVVCSDAQSCSSDSQCRTEKCLSGPSGGVMCLIMGTCATRRYCAQCNPNLKQTGCRTNEICTGFVCHSLSPVNINIPRPRTALQPVYLPSYPVPVYSVYPGAPFPLVYRRF